MDGRDGDGDGRATAELSECSRSFHDGEKAAVVNHMTACHMGTGVRTRQNGPVGSAEATFTQTWSLSAMKRTWTEKEKKSWTAGWTRAERSSPGPGQI